MPKIHTTIRLDHKLKEAAKKAAAKEHRNLNNLIEHLLLERCAKEGIPIK